MMTTRQFIQGGSFPIFIFDSVPKPALADYRPGPTTVFQLPFHNNCGMVSDQLERGGQEPKVRFLVSN